MSEISLGTEVTKKDFNFFWNNCSQKIKGFTEDDNYVIFNNLIYMVNNYSAVRFKLLNSVLSYNFTFNAEDHFQKFKTSKKNYEHGSLSANGYSFTIEGKDYLYKPDYKRYKELKEMWTNKVENFFKEEDKATSVEVELTSDHIKEMNRMKVFVIKVDNNGEFSLDYSYGDHHKFFFQNRLDKKILLTLDSDDTMKFVLVKSKKRSFSELWFDTQSKNYAYLQVFKIVNS